ncbi:MAG: YciI family protein [Thermoplasmata archaeon]
MAAQSEVDRLPMMATYVLGLFRRPADLPVIPAEEVERIQEGHMGNIRRLTEAGELIVAGPFTEDTHLRGVLVFSTSSVERARELTANDPALVQGRLLLDLYTWYAPAGLRVGPPPRNPTELDFQTD